MYIMSCADYVTNFPYDVFSRYSMWQVVTQRTLLIVITVLMLLLSLTLMDIISVIDLPPKEKFNTFVYLQYKIGQIFQTTPVVTSKYIVCVTCHYLVGMSVLILVCTVLVHIVIYWIRRTKSLRQGNANSGNSL